MVWSTPAYNTQHWPATDSSPAWVKIVGPALAALAGSGVSFSSESVDDLNGLAPALSELLSRLADDEEIVPLLLKRVSCEFEGKLTYLKNETLIDAVFENETGLKDLIMVLKLSLEV